ncbi:MAG: hypothetical protein HY735_19070 [Verrucomicrobia bacterium]|nr:hypothetical protein [Verrucomicrobiota bacterium]
MKPKTEKLDVGACAQMFNWHKLRAESLEYKLQIRLSKHRPRKSDDRQLREEYEMHRRFERELEELFSYSVRGEAPRFG